MVLIRFQQAHSSHLWLWSGPRRWRTHLQIRSVALPARCQRQLRLLLPARAQFRARHRLAWANARSVIGAAVSARDEKMIESKSAYLNSTAPCSVATME